MSERGVKTGLNTCQHWVGMGLGTMTAGTGWVWGTFFLNWPGLDEVGINYAGMGGDSDH